VWDRILVGCLVMAYLVYQMMLVIIEGVNGDECG
jgi:hypothetical protein